MKKIILAMTVALALAGCAQLQTLFEAKVSPTAVYVARNAADAEIISATNYLVLCHKAPTTPGCAKDIERQVANATRSVRAARNAVTAYLVQHPDAIGASGAYDALVSATQVLKQILELYGAQQ